MALGRYQSAVYEWTTALQRDPQLAQAYLGRAKCYIRLRLWDRALADLEQAAAWSEADLRLEWDTALAYAMCLPERPGHRGRWLQMVAGTARNSWDLVPVMGLRPRLPQ